MRARGSRWRTVRYLTALSALASLVAGLWTIWKAPLDYLFIGIGLAAVLFPTLFAVFAFTGERIEEAETPPVPVMRASKTLVDDVPGTEAAVEGGGVYLETTAPVEVAE